MISRSVWQENRLHGCVYCHHLLPYDCSRSFIETIDAHRRTLNIDRIEAASHQTSHAENRRKTAEALIRRLAETYQISNINRIKPGIAEATRAVLRRVPDHILITSRTDPDVRLLLHLADTLKLPVTEAGATLHPYRAVTIIRQVS